MTHLDQAREYLAIAESGDSKREAYRHAAEEIAAHIAETGESMRAVGRALQCAEGRVRALLRWRVAGYPEGTTPFTMADPGGSRPTDRAAVSHAKKVLREAPMEVVEQMLSELPAERVQQIGAATGNRHLAARQKMDDEERAMTPAQRKEREAIVGEVGRAARSVAAPFSTLSIATHIEAATELLAELNADHSVTPEMIATIEQALAELLVEVEVAKGLAGIEGGVT